MGGNIAVTTIRTRRKAMDSSYGQTDANTMVDGMEVSNTERPYTPVPRAK